MNAFFSAKEYLQWLINSKARHGIHSPFLYQFLDQCLYRESEESLFEIPEKHRRNLKNDHTILEYIDLGAGKRNQRNNNSNKKIKRIEVRQIALNSLQQPRYCRLFYRMIKYFDCRNVLEIGTSFGVTTSYMSLAGAHVKIDSIEGVYPIAELAGNYFSENKLTNIILHRGNFDFILEDVISGKSYDLVFMDGNHRGSRTLEYFQKLIKHINPEGVVIIDDIRWSESMLNAWKKIKNHNDVTLSIDLFRMGIVFFDIRLKKQEFAIRF